MGVGRGSQNIGEAGDRGVADPLGIRNSALVFPYQVWSV